MDIAANAADVFRWSTNLHSCLAYLQNVRKCVSSLITFAYESSWK